MTQVKMKVLDTVHISNLQADNFKRDDIIHVSETDAKILEANGSAERVGGAKAERAPANKAEAAPANKAISADSVQAPVRRFASKGKR